MVWGEREKTLVFSLSLLITNISHFKFFDDENVFEPDILFVSKERFGIIHDDGIHGAPDLIIEIISVTSGYHDTKTKKRIYEKYGVKEYWIVDTADLEVIGFKSQNGQFFEFFNRFRVIQIDLLIRA